MLRMIRQTKKPCLAFKLFGAGRASGSPRGGRARLPLCLAGIKPTDAVIVGMYPRFKDEVRENTELVRRILTPA